MDPTLHRNITNFAASTKWLGGDQVRLDQFTCVMPDGVNHVVDLIEPRTEEPGVMIDGKDINFAYQDARWDGMVQAISTHCLDRLVSRYMTKAGFTQEKNLQLFSRDDIPVVEAYTEVTDMIRLSIRLPHDRHWFHEKYAVPELEGLTPEFVEDCLQTATLSFKHYRTALEALQNMKTLILGVEGLDLRIIPKEEGVEISYVQPDNEFPMVMLRTRQDPDGLAYSVSLNSTPSDWEYSLPAPLLAMMPKLWECLALSPEQAKQRVVAYRQAHDPAPLSPLESDIALA